MKTTHHPIELSPVRDIARTAFVYKKPGQKSGEIYIEKANGDTEIVTPLTRADAIALIAGLRSAFDIPDENAEKVELLQRTLDRTQEHIESISLVTAANIMFENGLRTAVLTPSRLITGQMPELEIIATRPDMITYRLKEEPLNAAD
ncbi:hypothetical protein DLQ85_21955 [Salmonella enterica subsp. enterica serovar Virchow]|nr:hypothetical protein [Salmonella enterica subsp. enterica serovar Virchow]EIS2778902.1 hypothetical protein [Salmonella enterica subsp. enterica serovar Typhimurium]